MNIRNKARFWLGVGMWSVEVLAMCIFGLTLINWDWLTTKVVLLILSISGVVLYNVIAGMLIVNGSGETKSEKSVRRYSKK